MMLQERPRQQFGGATRLQGLGETQHDAADAQYDDDAESQVEEEENEEQPQRHLQLAREQQQQQEIGHSLVLPRRLLKLRPEPAAIESNNNTTTTSPRNRSPYSRSHFRSRSSGAAFSSAPAMTRAHSSPSPGSPDFLNPRSAAQQSQQQQAAPQTYHQPPSQMRTPVRQRSPFAPSDEQHPRPRSPRSWEAGGLGISSIQEDVALDIPLSKPLIPLTRSGGSLRRSRPASPLHSVTNAVHPTSTPIAATSDGSGSPMLGPIQRYYSNESYPMSHGSSTSSVPSTPTSWMSRSRSPSISSLETIEDAGEDAEIKEAEAVEKLREAADAEGRRSSLDGGGPRMRGVGSRERKRWSVCGGERRGDLDLETIWED